MLLGELRLLNEAKLWELLKNIELPRGDGENTRARNLKLLS